MLKLFIGNKAYSSWSLRGWLAVKQSGLPFQEHIVPLYDSDWDQRREGNEFAPSSGKVPILWDEDTVVWDSLAIIEFLADRVGRDRFWPKDEAARAMARSMAAEMHSSFLALRRECPMNVRRTYVIEDPSQDLVQDVSRIMELWAQARARFGHGEDPYLFGTFSAVDIMFAPVVSRFISYGFRIPPFASAYCDAIITHPWMIQWIDAAQSEDWVIEKFENTAT